MSGTLSLTFDDGPDAYWTMRVLDALGQANARATFFMVGERVRSAPQAAVAVLAAGHEVQLHCERHLRHSELSQADIQFDTRAGLASLATVGVSPSLWRTPWGVRTQASERVARSHRLRLVNWTIDTHDWRGDAATTMLEAVRDRLEADAVVLSHDAVGPGALRGGCESTVELIHGLAQTARAEGFTIVPLGEALHAGAHRELGRGRVC